MMAASTGAEGGGTWPQADDEGDKPMVVPFVSISSSGLVSANDSSNWLLGCFGEKNGIEILNKF